LEALKHQYFKILEYAAYIFVPVFAGLFIVAPGFINLLYGPKWEPAVILFRALLPFGFANVLKMFSDGLVSSTGRPSILPKITSIRIVLLIVLLYSILRFGLLPLCIGVSLVQIFVMILQFVFLKRYYNMPFTLHFKALQAPLIFSMVMMISVVAIMRLLSGLHLYSTTALLIEVCSGLLIYFSLMLLFKKEIVSRLILVRQEWGNR
jgi:PST family polysaccharide transporter/lipopolysaccharide exporter